jgi:hypothetical protein
MLKLSPKRGGKLAPPRTFVLVEEPPPSAARPVGLFEALLAGHTEVLLQDVQDHPEKYDQELLPLLSEIVLRGKSRGELSQEECTLLDKGTLDFATFVQKPKEQKTVPETKTASFDPEEDFDFEEGFEVDDEASLRPDVELPEEEPPTYWWI